MGSLRFHIFCIIGLYSAGQKFRTFNSLFFVGPPGRRGPLLDPPDFFSNGVVHYVEFLRWPSPQKRLGLGQRKHSWLCTTLFEQIEWVQNGPPPQGGHQKIENQMCETFDKHCSLPRNFVIKNNSNQSSNYRNCIINQWFTNFFGW